MGAIKWYEVSCDQCGSGEHFRIGLDWKIQARETGWIISKGKKAFCSKECWIKYRAASAKNNGA